MNLFTLKRISADTCPKVRKKTSMRTPSITTLSSRQTRSTSIAVKAQARTNSPRTSSAGQGSQNLLTRKLFNQTVKNPLKRRPSPSHRSQFNTRASARLRRRSTDKDGDREKRKYLSKWARWSWLRRLKVQQVICLSIFRAEKMRLLSRRIR